jgi:hypothetical protein
VVALSAQGMAGMKNKKDKNEKETKRFFDIIFRQ